MTEVISFSTRKPIQKKLSEANPDGTESGEAAYASNIAYVSAKKHIDEISNVGESPPLAIVVLALYAENEKPKEKPSAKKSEKPDDPEYPDRIESYTCHFWVDPQIPFLAQSLPSLFSQYLETSIYGLDEEFDD